MTLLRQRMLEDLKLRGMSESTQEAYVRAVRQLAEHYKKSPDQISDEELRQYFLYLKNVRGIAENTLRVNLSGIKFYYKYTLGREFPTLELMRVPRMKKLPVVLSISEVRQNPWASSTIALSGMLDPDLLMWATFERRAFSESCEY